MTSRHPWQGFHREFRADDSQPSWLGRQPGPVPQIPFAVRRSGVSLIRSCGRETSGPGRSHAGRGLWARAGVGRLSPPGSTGSGTARRPARMNLPGCSTGIQSPPARRDETEHLVARPPPHDPGPAGHRVEEQHLDAGDGATIAGTVSPRPAVSQRATTVGGAGSASLARNALRHRSPERLPPGAGDLAGSVELAGADASGERGPFDRIEGQRRTGRFPNFGCRALHVRQVRDTPSGSLNTCVLRVVDAGLPH
jgi:hypothetical protein